MRIPRDIERSHLLRAIGEIEDGGGVETAVPIRRRSTKFDVLFKRKKYPPKWLICISHKYVDGKEWPNVFAGGPEANNFLISRGFVIVRKTGQRVGLEAEDEAEESTFPEGKAAYRFHRKLERDSSIAKAAKNRRLRQSGDLSCDVCRFSFKKTYGVIGAGFIEAHCTVPVSKLKGRRKTKIGEIALVCSNCHRMLHRAVPWLSIGDLKEILRS